MDLDRDNIEKKDFPIGRRGYDPGAVDAHLREVAREVAALRDAARSTSEEASLAAAASARVQTILEAAETTAATLEREGHAQALRLREEAEAGAEQARDEAVARAEAHVQAVAKATSLMLERLAAMESEMSKLVEGVRAGVQRVSADLATLEAGLAELYEAGGPTSGAVARRASDASDEDAPRAEPQTRSSPAASPPEPAPAPAPSDPAGARARVAAPKPARARGTSPESGGAEVAANGGGGADIDGARLIVLNMALSGQSREEAERYLKESFQLADPKALVDEAFSEVDD